ncbi:hypothetical protein Ais01nite_40200 [Asanoa ishikariensis]|nr:hypothetical protein Ais01nite_40200 [Asanoa ishikariensis]
MRLGIDNGHLGLAGTQLLRHAKGCVKPDVPGTDHENPLRSHAVNDPLNGPGSPPQKARL